MIDTEEYKKYIQAPLNHIKGKVIRRVNFAMLDANAHSKGNADDIYSACIAALIFDDCLLLVSPGWNPALRNEPFHYHIQFEILDTTLPLIHPVMEWVDMTDHNCWKTIINSKVEALWLVESDSVPQGVIIEFPMMRIGILLGQIHDSTIHFGDSDEIIVMPDTSDILNQFNTISTWLPKAVLRKFNWN